MCRPAGGTAQPAQKCFAEKEEEIEQGDNGEQRADEIQLRQGCNDIKGEQGRIQPCQPFDFDRENEQQHRGALLSEVTGLHLQFSFMNKIIDLKSTAEELLKTHTAVLFV